jgi:hypothetical protein
MNILLGDFIDKVVMEDIFKPIIWNESLHDINNVSCHHSAHHYRDIKSSKQIIWKYVSSNIWERE